MNEFTFQTPGRRGRRHWLCAIEGLGRGAAEAGVRPEVDVVVEGDGGPGFEVFEGKGAGRL